MLQHLIAAASHCFSCFLNHKNKGRLQKLETSRTTTFGPMKEFNSRPCATNGYCVIEKIAPTVVVKPNTRPTNFGGKFRIANVVAMLKKIERNTVNKTKVPICTSTGVGINIKIEWTTPTTSTIRIVVDCLLLSKIHPTPGDIIKPHGKIEPKIPSSELAFEVI